MYTFEDIILWGYQRILETLRKVMRRSEVQLCKGMLKDDLWRHTHRYWRWGHAYRRTFKTHERNSAPSYVYKTLWWTLNFCLSVLLVLRYVYRAFKDTRESYYLSSQPYWGSLKALYCRHLVWYILIIHWCAIIIVHSSEFITVVYALKNLCKAV